MSSRNALTICECITSLACTAATHALRNLIARGGSETGGAQYLARRSNVFLPRALGPVISQLQKNVKCSHPWIRLSYIQSEKHVGQGADAAVVAAMVSISSIKGWFSVNRILRILGEIGCGVLRRGQDATADELLSLWIPDTPPSRAKLAWAVEFANRLHGVEPHLNRRATGMTAVDGCADAGAFAWDWDDELPSYICAHTPERGSHEHLPIRGRPGANRSRPLSAR